MGVRQIAADEGGAVSVEWMVLAGAIVGLAIVSTGSVGGSSKEVVFHVSGDLLPGQDAGSSGLDGGSDDGTTGNNGKGSGRNR